jgi:DNA-binding transcriptional MerR regulator
MVAAMDLLSIGRFARLAGLTVRAVRFYGELGLLEPALVDEDTGYRYYTSAQLQRAAAIRRLRSLELSLDEITEILALADPLQTRERLLRHRAHMLGVAANAERILEELDALIEGKEPLVPEPDYTGIVVKTLSAVGVLTIRERVALDDLKRVIPSAYAELMAYVREIGSTLVEPWTITVCPFADEDGLVSIENNVVVAEELPGRGRIEAGKLAACTAACVVHRGPYEDLDRSYRTLSSWLDEHEVVPTDAPLEIYWSDPEETDPADLITEIAWPIPAESARRLRDATTAARA